MKEGDAVEWTAVNRVFYGTIVSKYPLGWLVVLNNGKAIIADENSLRYEGQFQSQH